MDHSLISCSACRAYGVPLFGFDNLCEFCYTTNERPRQGLQPGHLPHYLDGVPGGRTTHIALTAIDQEDLFYIRQRRHKREQARQKMREERTRR